MWRRMCDGLFTSINLNYVPDCYLSIFYGDNITHNSSVHKRYKHMTTPTLNWGVIGSAILYDCQVVANYGHMLCDLHQKLRLHQ